MLNCTASDFSQETSGTGQGGLPSEDTIYGVLLMIFGRANERLLQKQRQGGRKLLLQDFDIALSGPSCACCGICKACLMFDYITTAYTLKMLHSD